MSTKSKTLAKSLHTITALAKLAQYIHAAQPKGTPIEWAMERALIVLGYDGCADPYGLAAKATAQLEAAAKAHPLDLAA